MNGMIHVALMKTVVAVVLLAVSLTAPATAHADDVPTVDQVVAIMAELTDPDRPAASKTDIVTPGFTPEEAQTIDDHLHRMNAVGMLPLAFDVTNIQPAPNNFAGATVAVPRGYQSTPAGPIVLVEQDRHWLITHDDAVSALDAFWFNANRRARWIPGL
jgi:hypothetical protein